MARATRIALFEREVRERLSRAALELVLGRAEVISEGQRGVRNGRDAYFGSTMLTIDLPSLDLLLRDACDAGTARRLAELLESDATAGTRIEALAEAEAARVAGATPTSVSTHVAIRSQAAKVFIDIDVEAVFDLRDDGRSDLQLRRRGEDPRHRREQAALLGAGRVRRPVGAARRQAGVFVPGPGQRQGGQGAARPRVQGGRDPQGDRRRARALPHLDRPLDRMRVAFDGTRLVVVDDDTAFEPSGQRVFDFGLAELAGKVGYAPPPHGAEARAAARRAVPLRRAAAGRTSRRPRPR